MPKVLVIGAHPDDCELKAGGTARQWVDHGFDVTFVSVTDGRAGHHEMPAEELVVRRKEEARRAAQALGVKSIVLDHHDGELLPTLEARLDIIRLIRCEKPDLVLTHRPNDYHPDHRYTSQLVQDAAYMVTVPRIAPEVPALRIDPVFGYLSDHFTSPTPFRADVIVPIDVAMDALLAAIDAHASQFYEWLPYNMGILDNVPTDPSARKKLVADWFQDGYALKSIQFRERVHDASVTFVEAFEISEYGAKLTDERRNLLFPFPTY
ncbi:PIG-L family deacetylase [bacterium]|nr:PIG-L family deacetylase [bacterium]